eukprot:TRINITY_DN52915_c0_g1_i2.p1 TRINITY_DN52915_c0_g1~~TRINITY_DN52915_c0_g1_i2.p1  ORF type:complete len:233 (-),score=72.87 TRINITY_DN52915_c0_g1_i2:51-749(-)
MPLWAWALLALLGATVYLLYFNASVRAAYHRRRVAHYFGVKHRRHHLKKGAGKQCVCDGPKCEQRRFAASAELGRVYQWNMAQEEMRSKEPIVSFNADRPLRVMSWNIEFGYQFESIVKELRRVKPDVVLLQEVDCVYDGHHLSLNVAKRLAKLLGYNAVWSPHHRYEMQEGPSKASTSGHGLWGCAILSRFPLRGGRFVALPDVIEGYSRSCLGAYRLFTELDGWLVGRLG